MNFTYERVNKLCQVLKNLIPLENHPLDGFLRKECDYKSGSDLPPVDNSWVPFEKGQRWGGKADGHCWFYKKFDLPQELRGKEIRLQVLTGLEDQWCGENPQFIVYLDGKSIQAMDTNHYQILLPRQDSYELYLYAYYSMYDRYMEFIPSLLVEDADTKTLYYHLKTPLDVCAFLDPISKERTDILTYLNNAVNLLDLRIPHSAAYQASIKAAVAYLETEFYGGYCHEQPVTTVCVGHTHIDVAWLWTIDQTVEKAQRSFATVIHLMKQYPEYKFMSSQPQLYAYVKQEDPELYAEIKEMVAEGRWEVEGAMWLEADCNLPSGESLVRQLLFGKRFMQEEFGVDSRILWLPDVFGYSAALPQILQKAGVDKFVTSKISWNESNRMPYDTFRWEGIDGTELLTYFLTAQQKKFGESPATYATYNGELNAAHVAGTWDRYQQKELNNESMLTYGWGDGGGGPTEEMLETGLRLAKGIPGCPQVRMDTATDFLDRLAEKTKDDPRLPKWVGELYLEYHRGTYTSIAKNKRNNRKSEFLYQDAEWLAAMDSILCGGSYPQKKLNENWEKILTRQFHDIIPGSSIKPVYDECDKTYAEILTQGHDMLRDSARHLASQVRTDGGLLVLNPNSFESRGFVNLDGKRVYAQGVPAKGYAVIAPAEQASEVCVGDHRLENDFFAVTFDEQYRMTSVYDKRNHREVLRAGEKGNVLQVFSDYPHNFDAWDINDYYQEVMWEMDDVTAAEPVRDGVGAGFRIRRNFQRSTLTQTIWLYDRIDRIDFDTQIDWHEDHLLLKTAFPVDVHSDKATYEIQFGTLERPTHSNTSWDAAKFEVCAHKFADLSEYGYGVSLLNDCKYGYDIHNGLMRLSLLKSATYPNPQADQGEHRFVYSLYPHKGTWQEADTVAQAFDLNNPMQAVAVAAQAGSLPERMSLVSSSAENVIIDTVKKAEDEDAWIIRLYECRNQRTNTTLSFGFPVESVHLCSLLEQNEKVLAADENKISLTVKPYEIITLKVTTASV